MPRGEAPRILILRLSALGDIVFATALLQALRERWPQAHIAWLAQQNFAGILQNDPRLDELIIAPAGLLKSPKTMWRLRRELSARRFDLVLDAQGLLKSRVVAALAGGARRIGFASKEPGGFMMHHLLPKGGRISDISSEYRYLAERLTGQPAGPPRLQVSDATRTSVGQTMHDRGLQAGFVALCPFTTRPQKHWPESCWPQLAQQLHARGIGPCVLFGGPGDRDAAARIMAAMPAGSIDLVGATRLAELPGWLQQAGLVVGVDTGLTHIGIAVQRPTLALFGSTCPYTGGAVSPLTVLYDTLPCSPCKRRPSCGGVYTCMRMLTPERVTHAAAMLLGQPP